MTIAITIIQTITNVFCFACTLFTTHKALKLAEMLNEEREKTTKLKDDFNAIKYYNTTLYNELKELKNEKENH